MAAREERNRRDKPFRLLDLPAELWSKIAKIVIQDTTSLGRGLVTPNRKNHHIEQPPITRTCRILRAELLHYYYQTRIDYTIRHWHDVEQVETWLKDIGPENRSMVRGLRLCSVAQDDNLRRHVARIQERWGIDIALELEHAGDYIRVYEVRLLS